MENIMEKELTLLRMATSTKGAGLMVFNRVRVLIFMLMVINTKVNGFKARNKVREYIHTQTEKLMKEVGIRIYFTEKQLLLSKMVASFRVNSIWANFMVKVQ